MTLREGTFEKSQIIRNSTVPGVPLSLRRAAELLRMFSEPLREPTKEPEAFLHSSPPPITASVGPVAFPSAPETAPAEALKVNSITPRGEVRRAARISISFSHPMRAVGDAKENSDPPGILLSPRPKGTWRWLDTQTLIFEPEGGELPRATSYAVKLSSEVNALKGNKLGTSVSSTFTLSPPKVIAMTPESDNVGLQPVLTVKFDQPVVRESVLSKVHLQRTARRVPIRELTVTEAEALQTGIEEQIKTVPPDTTFLFTPTEPLTRGTDYTLVAEAGIESQEGPRRMLQAFHSKFSTYHPLKLLPSESKKDPGPSDPLVLRFNNDLSSFDPRFVTVTPAIPNMRVRSHGSRMGILGRKDGNSTYKVTVSRELRDKFGQTLGKPIVAKFVTGPAPKRLHSTLGSMAVIDPTVSSSLTFFSTNIEKVNLEVRRVEPEDWEAYSKLERGRRASIADHSHEKFPGTELAKSTLTIEGQPDTLTETRLDLSQYLNDGKGNLIVLLTDPTADLETRRYREILTWVQSTSLGLDLEASENKIVALVTKLQDGAPVSGAQVVVGTQFGTTKADGTVTFQLPAEPAKNTTVKTTFDQAFLPGDPRHVRERGPSWKGTDVDGNWLLFSDRDLYRPGETAHIKGYVRQWRGGPPSKLQKVGRPGQRVHWVLEGYSEDVLAEGDTELSAFGTIDFKIEVPRESEQGHHYVIVRGDGLPEGYVHGLYVDEFRRPEFEVNTEVLSPGPHLLQGSVTVEAKAEYYAGGPLAGAQVDWYAGSEDATYTPPGRGDYTFGRWAPWWDMGPWWPDDYRGFDYQEFSGTANSEGEHKLETGFDRLYPPRPTRVSIGASVVDVNNQRQFGKSTVLVHPSARYVGLKSEKSFVKEQGDFRVEAIVTDIDGTILPDIPIELSLMEISYELDEMGIYREVEKLSQRLTVTSSSTPVDVQLTPPKSGSYYVRAEVVDEMGRPNRTEFRMWKAGGTMPTQGMMELEPLSLVPDRKEYIPGQTAEILVMAPFTEGEGLVVWAHDGILKEERFALKDGSATLRYPLSKKLIPNLRAKVTVVGKTRWGEGERPAIAAGRLNLPISSADRKLNIELLPEGAKLKPGNEVELQALVKDKYGEPVSGCEVTLWMVDESVLDLAAYRIPDPFWAFYGARPSGVSGSHLRPYVALGSPGPPGGKSPQQTALETKVAFEPPPPPEYRFTERKNFNPLATFKGDLVTDSSGRTKIKVKLPDNLTRYRIFSMAVQGDAYFGTGDQVLTAQLPLMVRPSLPRFLNLGDKSKLPVVVQNLNDRPLEAEIVGEAVGVTWVGPKGRKVTVPANDRVEVSFECRADQVGKAHFRFGALASGGLSDAANVSLPVHHPATEETFATYGSIEDEGAIGQSVLRPTDALAQLGGLKLSFSSTALSELTDAFLYLYTYPHECCEQKASRLLSIAALHDVLGVFNANGMPDAESIESRLGEDLRNLLRLQNSDGGWEFWRRDGHSVPFVSVHVTHTLVRLKSAGFSIDEDALRKAMGYLTEIESKCKELKYDPNTTRSCLAYALYVRHLYGKRDLARARSLFQELRQEQNLDLEALGWLWPVLSEQPEVAELQRLVMNRVSETSDKAQFIMSFGENELQQLVLGSDQRTNAVILCALLDDDQSNPLNAKLLRGLLAQRFKGRWDSTQENAWALLAAQKYFRTSEREAPNFVARAWLGDRYLGEEPFYSRSRKATQLGLPMAVLPEKSTELVLEKRGPGRLYYRIGLNSFSKRTNLPAESRGFTIERTYRGLDDPKDTVRNNQGDWEIRAGARVEVELTLVVPEQRYHVALIDPLPAGLEASEPAPANNGRRWHDHENLRDDRVEVFASLLEPGVYSYKYIALATTPGAFVLPPANAEEMYSPETNGRCASARVTIE